MYQTTVGIFLNNNLFKLLYIAKFSSDTGIFIIHDIMEGGATDALFKSILYKYYKYMIPGSGL